MEPWKKFASDSFEEQRILTLYLELREEFKRLGFSEKDLERPTFYSQKMWQLHSLLQSNFNSLFKKINDYGLEVSKNKFDKYIESKLQKINELTPLNDGNQERDN
jgi:hypothetical protein